MPRRDARASTETDLLVASGYAGRRAYTCATVCVVLDHRLQILLDDERYRKVEREARRRRVSIAAVIRDALDRLPIEVNGRRAAIDAILAAEPMSLPDDPAALRRELDDATDRIGA